MYDSWEEIGSLNIEKIHPESYASIFSKITLSPFTIFDLKCVVYEDEKIRCENGIVFFNELREKILLVASVSPGSVSVKAKFSEVPFYPQLDLEELEYVEI